MASVVRIKRRRTDDPAEALILSHKKSRVINDSQDDANSISNANIEESVLEFAGTLASKDEPVSKHIKDAIRKKKIHKEMHPHFTDFKMAPAPERMRKIRKQKEESSHNNRYRITCSRRALDVDKLDQDPVDDNDTDGEKLCEGGDNSQSRLKSLEECQDENKENSAKLLSDTVKEQAMQQSLVACYPFVGDNSGKESKSPGDFCGSKCEGETKEEKLFCLIDVEHDKSPESVTRSAASSITVNGMPMSQMKTRVPIAEESDDYVYDLYFTHTRLTGIQDEAVVTVEALCHEFMHGERDDEGEDFVYEDEDDSNDEDNWRNDYPDEDPHFFENAELDYDYENNMRENVIDRDDEGDLLSYWMDTRCKIDVDCNDFADDDERHASSSDEEAGAELGYY